MCAHLCVHGYRSIFSVLVARVFVSFVTCMWISILVAMNDVLVCTFVRLFENECTNVCVDLYEHCKFVCVCVCVYIYIYMELEDVHISKCMHSLCSE